MSPPILHIEVGLKGYNCTCEKKKHVLKPSVAPGEAKASPVVSHSGDVALWVM